MWLLGFLSASSGILIGGTIAWLFKGLQQKVADNVFPSPFWFTPMRSVLSVRRFMFLFVCFSSSLWVVPKYVEFLVGIAPVLVNLHKGLEVNLLAKELFKCLACLGCHFLQSLALMTDDDALLAVALDINHCIDADLFYPFLVVSQAFF